MAAITPVERKKLQKISKDIESKKIKIARYRDELRDIYNDLEYTLETIDESLEQLEDAKMSFDNAIDTLSQDL